MIDISRTDFSHRTTAILFGLFFFLSFLSYGSGSAMVATLADGADGLAGIFDARGTFTIGIILTAIVHTFTNLALPVLMLPIFKRVSPVLAYGYLALALTATVAVIMGAMFLALLVPLSEAREAAGGDTGYFDTLAMLMGRGGFYGYQIGMTLWGLGGLLLARLLYVSELVPRFLPVWGLVGYIALMVGTIAELFGYGIGVKMSLTGGVAELTLSVWLIVKGFNHSKLANLKAA